MLTHLPLDKMAAISQTKFCTCIFMNERFLHSDSSFTEVYIWLTNWQSLLVRVMAWRRTGDKPLPEPMLTKFTDAYICVLLQFAFLVIFTTEYIPQTDFIRNNSYTIAITWYLARYVDGWYLLTHDDMSCIYGKDSMHISTVLRRDNHLWNQESGIIYSRKFTIHAIYKRIHTVQGNMKQYSLMWPGDFH